MKLVYLLLIAIYAVATVSADTLKLLKCVSVCVSRRASYCPNGKKNTQNRCSLQEKMPEKECRTKCSEIRNECRNTEACKKQGRKKAKKIGGGKKKKINGPTKKIIKKKDGSLFCPGWEGWEIKKFKSSGCPRSCQFEKVYPESKCRSNCARVRNGLCPVK